MAFQDGTFTSPVQDGPKRVFYPFANAPTKDTTTTGTERKYVVLPSSFSPAAALTTDPDDATQYLVEETEPAIDFSGFYRFARTFCKVPGQQVSYGSRLLVRPVMNDIKYSTFYAVSFDSGISSWIFAARKTASISGAPDVPSTAEGATASSLPVLTITIDSTGGSSVSFSTSDSASSIQSTVSGTFGSNISVSRGDTNITISGSSLTAKSVGASGSGVEIMLSGTPLSSQEIRITASNQLVGSTRTISSTGHGGAAGDLVALWNGDKLWSAGRVVSVTTDTFTIKLDLAPGKDDVITHCQFAKNGLRLANDAVSVTTKETANFALPGVTSGISSPADITLATPQTAPLNWLTAICGADGSWTATATAATDYVTKAAHGLSTGDVLWIQSISSGAGGVSTMTLYYAIRVDADNFKLATSHANAIAGSGVNISSDGTGLAVLVPSQWPVVEGSNVQPWRGPIYQQTIVSAQMSDALDMLTASA